MFHINLSPRTISQKVEVTIKSQKDWHVGGKAINQKNL